MGSSGNECEYAQCATNTPRGLPCAEAGAARTLETTMIVMRAIAEHDERAVMRPMATPSTGIVRRSWEDATCRTTQSPLSAARVPEADAVAEPPSKASRRACAVERSFEPRLYLPSRTGGRAILAAMMLRLDSRNTLSG